MTTKITKLPDFPFIIAEPTGKSYIVTAGSQRGRVDMHGLGCEWYAENLYSVTSVINHINDGTWKLVQPKNDADSTITIDVDTSALDASLAKAKELEATLLRVKVLMQELAK